jgi:hypothetical protein
LFVCSGAVKNLYNMESHYHSIRAMKSNVVRDLSELSRVYLFVLEQ